jgi:hypothetical protein
LKKRVLFFNRPITPSRREAAPLLKKLLRLCFPFAIDSSKNDLRTIAAQYFLRHYSIVDEK